jgi:hypothetical protein
VAGLAAFAGQGGQGGVLQADVADGEVGEFLDPGGGVVEGGEQGRVAAAGPGGPVGLGEQEAGLLDGEVVDGRLGCFWRGWRGCPGSRPSGWGPAVCIQRWNELIAARRWLRVDALLCRLVCSQSRNPVMAAASR